MQPDTWRGPPHARVLQGAQRALGWALGRPHRDPEKEIQEIPS